MQTFQGKVAAITGAGSGIGRELAIQLAAQGCHLSLADLDETNVSATAALARDTNPAVRVTVSTLDVADREAVFAWAERTANEYGKINLIFNNAGVALSGTAEATTIDKFTWLMNINFWGVVHGTQAFLPYLRASGNGHVVNTSSLFGLLAAPGSSTYNAAKFAVRGYTESLRQELDLMRCGVSATCVLPGGIKTAIARNARTDASIAALGIDPATRTDKFSKNLVTSASRAAGIILAAVRQNKRRVLVGKDAVLLDKIQRVFPSAYAGVIRLMMRRTYGI
ncbi:SDR family NAD(P)-dependent oxidoreductase [Paraburkholderia caffeinilytica]|uniref:SDR family NAD(P)-dependent oxidoreductase n=1 Tax=Paraburkholderia caffeinilytica TaxID=1761016 RepID=UPI0038BA04C1